MMHKDRWRKIELGKHAYIKGRIGWRGLKAIEYTNDGPYLIAGNHLKNGRVNWSVCDHITMFRYNESLEIALEKGDIILTKDGTIGRVAIIDHLPGLATINSTMMLIRVREPLTPEYVYHYLNSIAFKKLVKEKVSGSSVPHIFQRDMMKLNIPIPTKFEQFRIAEILYTIDDAIQKTEALISKLKAMKQGLLHDLLTRGLDENGKLRDPKAHPEQFKDSSLGRIPKDWEVESFGRYVTTSAFGPRFSSDAYSDRGDVATLRTTDIDDEGNLSLSTMPLAKLDIGMFETHFLKTNDLLITRSGTCGIAAVFEKHIKPVLPGAFLIRFRIAKGLDPYFVKNYFNWEVGQRRLAGEAEGGVQKNLKGSSILKLTIPVPSETEQNNILKILDYHDARIRAEEKYRDKLKLQKKGLMHDLLTGKVRVKV